MPPPEKMPTIKSESNENPEQSQSGSHTQPQPASTNQTWTTVTFLKLSPSYDVGKFYGIAKNLTAFERYIESNFSVWC